MWMDHNNAQMVDLGSIGIVIATIFGWLPNIAALLTVIWMGLRVYEAYLTIQEKLRNKRKDNEPDAG